MKNWIVICLMFAMVICCLGGCSSAPDVAEPTVKEAEPTEAAEQEAICVYPATIDSFDSLESFLEYVSAAESGDGYADLASLEYFYLPIGLPEGYQLVKVNAGEMDIGFYYLPADADLSEEAVRMVDANKDHIQFISSRGYYKFESEMEQFGVTAEDLVDGKYILHEYAEKMMVVWEEDGNVLMLYLPRQFVFEDWSALCSAQKYVRMEDNTFQQLEEQQ